MDRFDLQTAYVYQLKLLCCNLDQTTIDMAKTDMKMINAMTLKTLIELLNG